MKAKLYTRWYRILPIRSVGGILRWLAEAKLGWLTTGFIRWFCWKYRVNLSEARLPVIGQYKSFAAFFKRPLADGVRPLGSAPVVVPADGRLTAWHSVCEDRLVMRAKGHLYTLAGLLGQEKAWIELFDRGVGSVIYLAPGNYHRVHMPCDGQLVGMRAIPGRLLPVQPALVAQVPELLETNERVVLVFTTPVGWMAQILIGAAMVGSIETIWHGVVAVRHSNRTIRYTDPALRLGKGDEMGAFSFGSTVITLFSNPSLQLSRGLQVPRKVQVREDFLYIP